MKTFTKELDEKLMIKVRSKFQMNKEAQKLELRQHPSIPFIMVHPEFFFKHYAISVTKDMLAGPLLKNLKVDGKKIEDPTEVVDHLMTRGSKNLMKDIKKNIVKSLQWVKYPFALIKSEENPHYPNVKKRLPVYASNIIGLQAHLATAIIYHPDMILRKEWAHKCEKHGDLIIWIVSELITFVCYAKDKWGMLEVGTWFAGYAKDVQRDIDANYKEGERTKYRSMCNPLRYNQKSCSLSIYKPDFNAGEYWIP
eukprot:CAMPEP_0117421596 /NCGR_PEP_ID=MMETSP0758-20121206/2639_1 /TAXON_ID=63605 /ORGANISM="Percolomonas cosmopolitus, Strain AE-1 (ATCC 50343)" /LENGTH=252 /DNA_ID=CAMNT_0005203781 /DNA_START=497 /DNA_END=1251 /DNA_ORIENTATION=+